MRPGFGKSSRKTLENRPLRAFSLVLAATLLAAPAAQSETAPFMASLAVAVSGDTADVYAARGHAAVWTAPDAAPRRAALLGALDHARFHGLPDPGADRLATLLRTARTEGDRARVEAALMGAFLTHVRSLRQGLIDPRDVDRGIHVVRHPFDPDAELRAFLAAPDPDRWLAALAPKAPEYARLMQARLDLLDVITGKGWGPPVGATLAPGDAGDDVVRLRDRLTAMGYLGRSVSASYDSALTAAVRRFQIDHGIAATGALDDTTLGALDTPAGDRLAAVTVALERMRWIGDAPRGARHIWVNLPDFTAKIVDHGKVTFWTRAVVGKNVPDQRTPEFSDTMEYLVVNPSWSVPRSITVKEYLPLLQRNPNAVRHLNVIDRSGRVVPRGAVNFAGYSARTFPFALRQPPSDGNALGKVKFMFPNEYNIYLHDTPAKDLFAHAVRAYSHGCIRLADPVDFAHAIMAVQHDNPSDEFDRILRTGDETTVRLDDTIPVHLVYFTAWPGARGQITYRADIYGRDAAIADALRAAGVVMGAPPA
jgi:murein L,D-transpeptidase YcbB/YkuD